MRRSGLRSIAIIGGGVAGWLAAAVLTRLLTPGYCKLLVVGAPQAARLGVGECTIPAFQRINKLLGFDEKDFITRTDATFRLGTEFKDWCAPGERFFHSFSEFGSVLAQVPFHHYWLRLRRLGDRADIQDYSVATAAARLGSFAYPGTDPASLLSSFSHAYHLDTALYATMLQEYATARGAVALGGIAVSAALRGADGFIESVSLADGRQVEADFFIDATGFPGLLIEGALKTGYDDWRQWLPCDRAVSVTETPDAALPPYTIVKACAAGWQWRIPLRHRTDTGYLYCSDFLSDEAALAALSVSEQNAAPRLSRFVQGVPKKFWHKNCLALPGGGMEPLESTNLHLIQTGILKLFGTFPDRDFDPADSSEYNRLAAIEHERIRDFLILHYCTARRGGAFWEHCRAMAVPDTLRHKLELFRASARIAMLDHEHFSEQSWLSLFFGHQLMPERYDPLADIPAPDELRRHLAAMADTISRTTRTLPGHRQFLAGIAPLGTR